ncbi:hypothetical protein WJX74_006962 [Apatococcus lobatus]
MYVSFPGTSPLSDWVANCDFRQVKVPEATFPDADYRVHAGFLSRFTEVSDSAEYKHFCDLARSGQVPLVVFTGHSLGGAVAALAALSFLSRQRRGDFPMSTKVMCITYGAPLVGSLDLQKAVQSSGWHKNFIHAVTRHDMVPRIFIAMKEGVVSEVAAGLWQLSGGTRSPEDQAVQIGWPRTQDAKADSKGLLEQALGSCSTLRSTASIICVICVSACQALFRTDHNYRPFGHILDDGGLHADCNVALHHLWLTRKQRKGPDVSRLPALLSHDLAAYWELVTNYSPIAGSGQRLGALRHEANSPFELGITQAMEELNQELGQKVDEVAIRLQAHARTLMARWVEDIEPISDLLETWINSFGEPTMAYEAFRCSPVEGKGSNRNVDRARRRIMHFWNDVEVQVREQGVDAIFTHDPNLLQRGHTWRTNFEMLDIANYYRRKLWTGYVEGEGHYLESDNRPAAYVMLEQLTRPNRRHADSTPFARKEQEAIQAAKSALAQLLQAAKDKEALSEYNHGAALQAAARQALEALKACTLPLTEKRLRKVLLDYDLSNQLPLPSRWQQPAKINMSAAIEGVIEQLWDGRCENGIP